MVAAEAQGVAARYVRREPLGVDIEHEEHRAVGKIGGQEIVRLPRIDRDDRAVVEQPTPVADVDRCRRAADMTDQMTLAVRMHVEGSVQLIHGRTTEPAVKYGERPAHP